ncbi:hypothetical protein [Sphingobacterium sp. UGAL515B_05]|uniref:hypothetical protein n=1 Tax=Sphingobacterium sp. UGAL515B_05 TaxID=2986767 RepID=UPI0029553224|nr:hypothetical protein [Sphingobacterium sp. UGAL515B_05]WON95049.1 hypothetical protein OK025_01225 [Sphingobacterium sp. UGAL515B_05]
MLTKFLNNYGYMILGGAMIIGFSAFKGAEVYAGKADNPVTIYFHGNPQDANQVKDASLWDTTSNDEDCNSANVMACSQVVDESDLNASDQLNPAKIQLDATATSGGNYIPSRTGGSSSTTFTPINRG